MFLVLCILVASVSCRLAPQQAGTQKLFGDLVHFIRQAGGFVDNGLVMEYSHLGSRGIFTTRVVEADEVLAKIPARVWLAPYANGCERYEVLLGELQKGSLSFYSSFLRLADANVRVLETWHPDILGGWQRR